MVLRGWRSIRQYADPVVFVCLFSRKKRHVERADQHLFVEGVDDVDLAKSQEQFDK